MKLKLARYEKKKKRMLNVRVLDSDRDLIVEKAKKYCDGNISQWIIYASSTLEPPKKDLIVCRD